MNVAKFLSFILTPKTCWRRLQNISSRRLQKNVSWATTTVINAAENKIPDVSKLVKKADYNTKISETENKITTDHDHDR